MRQVNTKHARINKAKPKKGGARTVTSQARHGHRAVRQVEPSPLVRIVRELMEITLVRHAAVALAALAVAGLLVWGVVKLSSREKFNDSMAVISKTVQATRRLYPLERADVGEGSVLISLVLARQYDELKVSLKWSEGRALNVTNEFGGKIDVVALKNHFELHYNGLPKAICAQLIQAYAASRMPLWVNTMYFSGRFDQEGALAACSAERNNLVWKFR